MRSVQIKHTILSSSLADVPPRGNADEVSAGGDRLQEKGPGPFFRNALLPPPPQKTARMKSTEKTACAELISKISTVAGAAPAKPPHTTHYCILTRRPSHLTPQAHQRLAGWEPGKHDYGVGTPSFQDGPRAAKITRRRRCAPSCLSQKRSLPAQAAVDEELEETRVSDAGASLSSHRETVLMEVVRAVFPFRSA